MSCFFCESNFHLSAYCNVYVTNESRLNILASKGCCDLCLSEKNNQHTSQMCRSQKKCSICFTKNHNTVFCPDRITAPNFFVPNIDADLFPRFLQMFDHVEQYSMALASSTTLSAATGTKLFVFDKIHQKFNLFDGNGIVGSVGDNTVEIFNWEGISSTVTAKIIEIRDPWILNNDFLGLLTYNVKEFKCNNVSLTSTVPFSDILQRMPNLESLDIPNSTMKYYWLNDLMKYKNGKNMKFLRLRIPHPWFDAEKLAIFMKTKCAPDVIIFLDLDITENSYCYDNRKRIAERISKSFIPTINIFDKIPRLTINGVKDQLYSYHLIGNFTLK